MKSEFVYGLPLSAAVYMNQKPSFISSELFICWLQKYFIPQKGEGEVLLILGGQTSHCSTSAMLELAKANIIILLCLPSHTTQYFQLLVSHSLNPSKITFMLKKPHGCDIILQEALFGFRQAGQLIGTAWKKAATVENAIPGIHAYGIFPSNPLQLMSTYLPCQIPFQLLR